MKLHILCLGAGIMFLRRYIKKGIIRITLDEIFYTTKESQIAVMKRLYPEVLTDEDLLTGEIQ